MFAVSSEYGSAIAQEDSMVPVRSLARSIMAATFVWMCHATAAHASAIQLNDFSELSAGGTLATYPAGAPSNPLTITAGGVTLTFSTDVLGFALDDGSFFAFPAAMTPILLNNQGNGPMTIEFSTGIREFGFLAQSAGVDIETFKFDVFGGASLLNTFTVGPADNTGLPAGLALFIGARATETDLITKLTLSSTSSLTSSGELFDNFFAVGPVTFTQAVAAEPVPEPASLLLLGTGLLVGAKRWRKRQPAA
jgi:hypothetical protein